MSVASNLSWLLSVLVHPYMPGISDEIQRQLQVGLTHVKGHFGIQGKVNLYPTLLKVN